MPSVCLITHSRSGPLPHCALAAHPSRANTRLSEQLDSRITTSSTDTTVGEKNPTRIFVNPLDMQCSFNSCCHSAIILSDPAMAALTAPKCSSKEEAELGQDPGCETNTRTSLEQVRHGCRPSCVGFPALQSQPLQLKLEQLSTMANSADDVECRLPMYLVPPRPNHVIRQLAKSSQMQATATNPPVHAGSSRHKSHRGIWAVTQAESSLSSKY